MIIRKNSSLFDNSLNEIFLPFMRAFKLNLAILTVVLSEFTDGNNPTIPSPNSELFPITDFSQCPNTKLCKNEDITASEVVNLTYFLLLNKPLISSDFNIPLKRSLLVIKEKLAAAGF
jgi:hypothetical protein